MCGQVIEKGRQRIKQAKGFRGREFPPGLGDGGGNVMELDPRQTPESAVPFVRAMPKVGRNEPCPCGSGRKFKHCHGTLQQANG